MNITLTPIEARIIGCLMEKQVTTPDQYPLSLNALTNACNQKTSREPVLDLSEAEVQQSVDSLMKKYWVSDRSAGYGGRVTKYQHRFCNTEFGSLKFSKQEFGIICVLLLRGAQTPGELRSRTSRLCDFPGGDAVEATLKGLMEREDGPFVARLSRSPGAREARYAHLFSGQPAAADAGASDGDDDDDTAAGAGTAALGAAPLAAAPRPIERLSERISALEQMMDQLRAELDELKRAARPP
jgi:uncharacterized protein YceH (UPF0502 family)